MTALLLLLSLLGNGPARSAHSARSSAFAMPGGLWIKPGSPALALERTPSDDLVPRAYLPLVARQPSACAPIPGAQYNTLSVLPPVTDRPAEEHADLNLALRGYELTDGYRGLVEYGGTPDAGAPKLYTLFADHRVPSLPAVYRVYDWDWEYNCRGDLLANWPVTLAGMGVTTGEILHLPDSGYEIGSGYEALVLYASEERITLKYTRDDNVIEGYTIHVENICVEPSLLALYRAWTSAGRGQLPALRAGQPFGRARGGEIGVAIRDAGTFMDPRSQNDWW
ncbi:MAG: hypothetical protein PVH95_04935 [Anaerolineae bacterium]